ncbi:hypothetical protein [Desulfitibacter alkalitolerans]|nr:hypothetical protein [Desulfitibacter alkalitolerans]
MMAIKIEHSGTRWLTALNICVPDNEGIYEMHSFCRLPVMNI